MNNRKFKTAKKIDLFDGNGNPWKMKGIVNAEKETEQFNTVSEGYTVVQHHEVVDMVEEALKDKNLKANTFIEELNNGARVHIELTFPEITLDVEGIGQEVALRCTYDNSYDGSTGLRLEVGAESPRQGGFLWLGGLVRALEDNYYHRHTKGVRVGEFGRKLDKGINSFQTKIKDHFTGMFKTPLTNQEALAFLEEVKEVKQVTGKYVDAIVSSCKAPLKNKWQLYCIICDTLSLEASSIDVRNRQLSLIITRLHRKIKNV